MHQYSVISSVKHILLDIMAIIIPLLSSYGAYIFTLFAISMVTYLLMQKRRKETQLQTNKTISVSENKQNQEVGNQVGSENNDR